MPSKKHEEILVAVINAVKSRGYTVVRLDPRNVPDAFYIEDGKPIAIEVETDQSKPYARCPEFEGVLLVKGRKIKHDHDDWVYVKVFELRKKGLSLPKIKDEMMNIYGVKLSLSTLHDWLRGKSIPRTIVITK